MKLLLNDKEIAKFLCELISVRDACKGIELDERHTAEVVAWIIELKSKTKFNLEKHRDKIKQKIYHGVRKDLKAWTDQINQQIANHKEHYYKNIHTHINRIIEKLGEDKILELYQGHRSQNFIKTVGLQIDPTATMMRRKDFNSVEEDCLLRNTVGNEQILVSKIDNNLPFWFIDSGYTNFIENNKKWHRLVRNHLHYNYYFDAPTDRLANFRSFPTPWRNTGNTILVVEPGPFAANIFHVDLKTWKQSIEQEIRKYTDRPIEFRSKTNKKIRKSLYQQLASGEYYCTISINSNSAVESIWAGIPAITLGQHISNPVTVNSISQIDNLYTGPLGNWLAWLSYSQFTYEELMDGTALSLIKKYHA